MNTWQIVVAVVVLVALVGLGLWWWRSRRPGPPPAIDLVSTALPTPGLTLAADADGALADDGGPDDADGGLGDGGGTGAADEAAGSGDHEVPESPKSRLARLRARLAGSSSALGSALLAVLSRDRLAQDDWDEMEEALLLADVGAEATGQILDALRLRLRVEGADAPSPREALRAELAAALDIGVSRELKVAGADGLPAVVLVVGVNGSGKTTAIGRIARLLVAEGKTVLLGAGDTFRAAAAEQLTTWGERVGVEVVAGPEGGDPASVAFDAVKAGIERGVDVVLIDTAGRLHNKSNLMAELSKIARVAAKQAPITEVLLVIDATTGQNGLAQGRIFAEATDVGGIVLTKLDGSAKGGIVIGVQQNLGVPVKLVGLGEGPDDLAPFDPAAFIDGMLG